MFSIEPTKSENYVARAFLPGASKSRRNILVSPIVADNAYSPASVMGHELGHVLGFRHEHNRPEAGTCFEDDNLVPLTPYDSRSIMHYPHCNGISEDMELSELDRKGVQLAYGAREEDPDGSDDPAAPECVLSVLSACTGSPGN
ncbi:hypothetical protein [Dietzia sp.]|uniref:hypothetical protein n=1 Tax=Dietzia sp. TaxID=1871616 RepID=UPI003FA604B7